MAVVGEIRIDTSVNKSGAVADVKSLQKSFDKFGQTLADAFNKATGAMFDKASKGAQELQAQSQQAQAEADAYKDKIDEVRGELDALKEASKDVGSASSESYERAANEAATLESKLEDVDRRLDITREKFKELAREEAAGTSNEGDNAWIIDRTEQLFEANQETQRLEASSAQLYQQLETTKTLAAQYKAEAEQAFVDSSVEQIREKERALASLGEKYTEATAKSTELGNAAQSAAAPANAAKFALDGLAFTAGKLYGAFTRVASAAVSLAQKGFNALKAGAKLAINAVKGLVSSLVKYVKQSKTIASVTGAISKAFGRLQGMLGSGIRKAMNTVIQSIKDGTQNLAKYSGEVNAAMSALKTETNYFKNNIAAAFSPIITAVVPMLATLVGWINSAISALGQLIAAFMGKGTYIKATKQQQDYAGSLGGSASAARDATEAVSELDKAVNQLGLDELNTFQNNDTSNSSGSGGSGSGASGLFEEAEIDEQFKKLAETFNKLLQPIKDAWKKYGPDVIASWTKALKNVKSLMLSIGKTWAEVWQKRGAETVGLFLQLLSEIGLVIADIASAWEQAWNTKGEAYVNSIFNLIDSTLNLVLVLSSTWREAWNDGTGISIMEHFHQIVSDINNTVSQLEDRFAEAWLESENGVAIWGILLGIIDDLLGHIEDMSSATLDWATNLNLEPLVSSFRNLLDNIRPLADTIGGAFAWAYENVLLPFSKWLIELAVPAALDLLSGAFSVITAAIDALKPLGIWIWENFLQPLASWTGGIIVSVMETLADILETVSEKITAISDWINEHQTAVENIAIVIGILALAIAAIAIAMNAQAIASGAVSIATGIWTAVSTAASVATAAFGSAMAILTSPITLIILAIAALVAGIILLVKNWDWVKEKAAAVWDAIVEKWNAAAAWFNEKIIEPIVEFFTNLWNTIKDAASAAWDWIVGVFVGAATWFNEKIIQPIQEFFTGLWNKVKDLASNAWQGIKDVWQAVSDWFNNTIVEPIANFFGGLWEGIKGGASTLATFMREKVIDPIVNLFKGMYNSVIGIIEGIINGFIGIINGFIGGINAVIETINRIPGVNLGSISTLSTVSLPRLAQGAVIPPNREFMAVLGDQRSGTNVEAPLSTIEDAVRRVMNEGGSGGNRISDIVAALRQLGIDSDALNVILQVDSREIARANNKGQGKLGQSYGGSFAYAR